jgi:hypothetical protein
MCKALGSIFISSAHTHIHTHTHKEGRKETRKKEKKEGRKEGRGKIHYIDEPHLYRH